MGHPPLVGISQDLSQVDPEFPGQRLVPMPPAHQQDELGLLVEGMNRLLERLEESLEHSRRAERRRAESEERLREMAESIQEVFWLADPATGQTLYVSPAFEQIWGYRLEELAAEPGLWMHAVHPGDRPKVAAAVQERAAGRSYDVEYRVVRPDGSHRWVHDRAFPVFSEAGEVRRLAGIAMDVTDRREAEEALARSARRISEQLGELDQIYRFAPVGLAVLDPGLKVVRINRILSELSPVPPADQAGRSLEQLFPELAEPMLEAAGVALEENRSLLGVELTGQTPASPGRDRSFLASFLPFRDADGKVLGIIAAALEITDRKEAEEDRRRLEAQMQQTQKLESLGVLAGGIAHDFNNLLMGVMGNAGLALMEMGPDDAARPWVEQVEKAAQRLAELTNQLLAYSGKGRFVSERMDLGGLVREMADLLGTVVSKKARVMFRLSPEPALVEGDPTQIRQVVMNLITNASEALGDGEGTVTISTGLVDADQDYLAGEYLDNPPPPGVYAFMEVRDTGSGMDAATRARVFEPFFTTKFTGRGMGLGAVLGIVRSHGGTIRVWSSPGQGSSFRVLIPQAVNPSAQVEEGAEAGSEEPLAGVTVLVVDDEEVVRDMTKSGLEYFGLQVLTAEDGKHALEAFRRHQEEIDLVLLDMTMPRMDGAQVFAELRQIDTSVPVILTSGFSESDATARFPGKGLAGFLQKPFRPADLVDKLSQVLGRGGSSGAKSGGAEPDGTEDEAA